MKKTPVFLSMLLAAWMCLCFGACHTTAPHTSTGEETQSHPESTALTEPEPRETEETNREDIVKIPVDIETIGGVVIVGQIGFDEKGWHIVPEQPLNITYTYFLDNPSVFPEQTRISMMDPKDDGVDKTVYLGQTVTVHGEFRFVRNDFETLYLLPHTVTIGKSVEGSYGDSELKAPDDPVDLYDRSKPLPKDMELRVMNGRYSYNAFMLSEESLMLMGNDFAFFYCDFVDAILNYRSEVACPEKGYAEMLGSVIYYDFPIFHACAEPFELIKHYHDETKTVSIVYKYNADEHQKLLDRFFESANEMLASASPDMRDIEKAKKIYHELCTRMIYDDSALKDFERKNSYYAYLHNSGVCVTFANVYNQLLTQVGIKTTIASCDYDATIGHVWSVVTLNGKDYFCDPTFELSYDNGNGYRYFGMNYADRTKSGMGKDGITAGKYGFTFTVLPEMIAEESLKG